MTVGPLAPDDLALVAPHFEALEGERLLVQQCDACGGLQWPPRELCRVCGSFEHSWVEVSREGTLYSWTEVWHATSEQLRAEVPFTVALVAVEGGAVRFVGRLLGSESPYVGAQVEAVFERAGERVLVQWRLSDDEEGK